MKQLRLEKFKWLPDAGRKLPVNFVIQNILLFITLFRRPCDSVPYPEKQWP